MFSVSVFYLFQNYIYSMIFFVFCADHGMRIEFKSQLLGLSFHHTGSVDQTQVVRLSNHHL